MITVKDTMPLQFIKKSDFSGSFKGMRYLLKKQEIEDKTVLTAYVWPEPFCFDKTAEEGKDCMEFPFTEEGQEQAVQWLNERYGERFLTE